MVSTHNHGITRLKSIVGSKEHQFLRNRLIGLDQLSHKRTSKVLEVLEMISFKQTFFVILDKSGIIFS